MKEILHLLTKNLEVAIHLSRQRTRRDESPYTKAPARASVRSRTSSGNFLTHGLFLGSSSATYVATYQRVYGAVLVLGKFYFTCTTSSSGLCAWRSRRVCPFLIWPASDITSHHSPHTAHKFMYLLAQYTRISVSKLIFFFHKNGEKIERIRKISISRAL